MSAQAKGKRIVVIGASAAGLKAAARARRLLPEASIVVLDERASISYAACGLPYYLSGDIQRLEALREMPFGVMRDEAYFAQVKGVEVRTGVRARRLDREARTVEAVASATGETVTLPYDDLVLATGAGPVLPPGVVAGGAVGTLLTLEDAETLRRGLETGRVGSAVVVGAGLIGCETALALCDLWGCRVTLVEAADRVLPQMLDREMGDLVAGELARAGVEVVTGARATRVVTVDGRAAVTIQTGGAARELDADRAVVAVGVAPRVDLARDAGLAIGPGGGLLVDDRLRAGDPHIHAAGDCIEAAHRVTGRPALMPYGSLANRQGRVVGDNLAGRDTRLPPAVGAACVKIAGWNVAVAGLSEAAAHTAGLTPRAVWGTFLDRPHYYPEHAALFMKLVYEAGGGRLLGLQAVGPGDAVKRADVFAALLQRDGRLEDLLDLEFCYAPPYNGPLDPLHSLGGIALGIEREGLAALPPSADLDGRAVIDLRSPDEIAGGVASPPGALNIPIMELRARAAELPADRALLLACAMGPRSAEAARWLLGQGRRDVAFLGGGVRMRAGV